MKVKCVRLLDSEGKEVLYSPWLVLNHIYHVMDTHIQSDGQRFFSIVSREPDGEWPQMGIHQAECFEIVSSYIPSSWQNWTHKDSSGSAPATWLEPGFYEAFYDHEPAAYSIFDRERALILREDP